MLSYLLHIQINAFLKLFHRYQDEIEGKLYAADQGFKSRFHDIVFPDYTEAELRTIFVDFIHELEWQLAAEDPKLPDVVARRIARGRNRKGFANAKTVRSLVGNSINASILRQGKGAKPVLKIIDCLGQRPDRKTFQNCKKRWMSFRE